MRKINHPAALTAVLIATQMFAYPICSRAQSPDATSHPALPNPAPFLALAADETNKLPLDPQNQSAFFALAYAQSLAKDLPSLRKTAALIQKNEDNVPEKDPGLKKSFQSINDAILAADFARAGDLERYRAYLAKALVDPDPDFIAPAYAAAHDYPNMLKAIESTDPAGLRDQFQHLARQLASTDPDEAHLLLKKIKKLAPVQDVPVEFSLAEAYADIGDADAAFAQARLIPKTSDYSLLVFDSLASDFDADFNRAAAKKARQEFVAAFAKAPPKTQDQERSALFRRQVELDDQKAAAETLQALIKYARSLPSIADSDLKHGYFVAAAQAAARLGDQKLTDQCIKEAGESFGDAFGGDPNIMQIGDLQEQEDSEKVAASHAQFLAQQGHPDQAAAAAAAITNPNRQAVALHTLILDAIIRNDAPAAIAAFNTLGQPDKPLSTPEEKGLILTERLSQIPPIASLIIASLNNPQKNASPIDPLKWIQSLPTPEERAAAATAIATTLLAPPPALPVNTLFP